MEWGTFKSTIRLPDNYYIDASAQCCLRKCISLKEKLTELMLNMFDTFEKKFIIGQF